MSKIVNEYGVLDREIYYKLHQPVIALTNAINNVAQTEKLTGEEIRQLYNEVIAEINCVGIEQVIRYGITQRKEFRAE